ncbi:MAG TPA: CocE/NonD family hydrolase [Alphaproteobacteria bacterium]|nr:CocE/NonD family hydrolase [Alphaproteobacteria bacterium]
MEIVTRFPRAVREIVNAEIPLSDGTRLAARIWLPEDAEKNPVPAILEYLPYRKRDGTSERDALTHPYYAGHGYACLRVDMRGSGESEGLLLDEYLKQEQDDALEVIDWIAAQGWCTGSLGIIGISWGGFNGLQIAARRPKPLKAIVTIASTDDRYADDIHHMGGCLLNDNLSWASTMFAYMSRPPDPALVGERWRQMWMYRLENTPLLIDNWLRHQRRDAFWKHGSVCENYADIECAVYAVGGWADGYSNAVPRLLAGLKSPRKGLIGPWAHKYPHFAKPGPAIGFLQETLRWWDQWLKGKDTGIMAEPMYRVWMEDPVRPAAYLPHRPGRWVAEPSWPSKNIRPVRFMLNPFRLAEAAEPETPITFSSPQDTGLDAGAWCPYGLGPDLPTDQREEDGKSLCFDGEVLTKPVEILGAPVVDVELTSDRPVAMIAARLCDIHPDGVSERVSYGLLNLTHRESHEHPSPLVPGRRYRVRVQLNDIAHSFKPGHRIRLTLSTSYWPTAFPMPEPVLMTLFTGVSSLELPVRLPRKEDQELKDFPPPEGAPPLAETTLREHATKRLVERDLATDECVFTRHEDTGTYRIDSIDLTIDQIKTGTYRVKSDDPLSADIEIKWTQKLARDDWQVRTETATRFRATREEFLIDATLDAYEAGKRIYTQTWERRIRRDLV